MDAMITVLERGFTWWDRSVFPRDEFEERTRAVQAAMRGAGLDALVIWSQSYHTNGDLAFLSGWPMGGALLVTGDGEPAMFSPGGGREQYFARMQTWVEDMRSTPAGLGGIIAQTLDEKGIMAGRVGIVGYDQMSAGALNDLKEKLSGYELVDFGTAYSAFRAPKRARELLAIRNSLTIARKAVEAGQAIYDAGGSNTDALVEAERVARLEGMRDFRGLANIAGSQLRPFERLGGARQPSLLLWVGIDCHGYWAHASNAAAGRPDSAAGRALAAMISAISHGVAAGDVAKAGLDALPEELRDNALSYGLGAAAGLSLNEAPAITPGNDEKLEEGQVLALHCCASGGDEPSLASAMVLVGQDSGELVEAR